MRALLTSFVIAGLFSALPVYGQNVDSALRSVRDERNDTVRMRALYRLAIQLEDGHIRDAIAVNKQLLIDADQHKNTRYIGRASHSLGVAYYITQQYPVSLQYLLVALRIAKDSKDYSDEIRVCFDISNVYDATGDLDKMKIYADEAWRICTQHNVVSLEAAVMDHLATVSKKRGLLDTAIQQYKISLQLSRDQHNTDGQIGALANLATAYKSNKNYSLSLDAYRGALSLIDTVNDIYPLTVITNNMAILFLDMDNLPLAKAYAYRALKYAPRANDPNITTDMYDVLRKIYTKEKNYELALDYFSRWAAIKDSALTKDKARQISELQTKYDTRAKDEQIYAQSKELIYNRKINATLIIASLLFLSLGVIIYRNKRETDKLNKLVTTQKQELEQLNEIKDRIFGVIGHDLRSPVNTLIAFTGLLEDNVFSAAELAEYTKLLKSNLGYTSRLLENLLNWARSQMKGYMSVFENFDVATTINQTVGVLLPDAGKKGVQIINNVPQGTTVLADSNITALIMRNLLSNAIKYTGSGGQIELLSQQAAGTVRIMIRDTGTGMCPEMVAAFHNNTIQPVKSTPGTANEKGTGLGLMLCRNFVALMNGTITVKSNPGAGTCFTIELPAAAKE